MDPHLPDHLGSTPERGRNIRERVDAFPDGLGVSPDRAGVPPDGGIVRENGPDTAPSLW